MEFIQTGNGYIKVDKEALYYKLLTECPDMFEGSHDVYMPRELVYSILSHLPSKEDSLIMFNVEFIFTMVYAFGVKPSSITFLSDHDRKTKIVSNIGCKVIREIRPGMKFKNVLTNPPYQTGNGESGGKHSLWRRFVDLAFKLATKNGYVTIVCPQFPHKARDLGKHFKQNTPLVLYNDVTGYFPGVGSSIKYWIVHLGKHSEKFMVDGVEWSHGLTRDPTLHTTASSIVAKVNHLPKFECKQDSMYSSSQLTNDSNEYFETPKGSSIFPIRHASKVKVCYVSKPTECHYKNKVMMTFSGYPNFEYYDGTTNPMSSCYQMSGYIEVADQEQGERLISLYKTKLYKFLSSLGKAGIKGKGSYSLPMLPLDRHWTDTEVYQQFSLTELEIDYVDNLFK